MPTKTKTNLFDVLNSNPMEKRRKSISPINFSEFIRP